MHHTLAYYESVDQATLGPIAALADPVLTVSGDNVVVPTVTPNVGLLFAIGVSMVRGQLVSPSLRRFVNMEVAPVNKAATPNSPVPLIDIMHSPLPLDAGEQLQFWGAEDGAGATVMNGVVNLVDQAVTPVTDNIFSVRATAAATLVAYAWTNSALTLDQVLPVGQYALVGARFESTGLICARFVFQNQTPRPGGIGLSDHAKLSPVNQRYGGWGVWGTFDSNTLPTVDFFSGSADTAEVVTLDLVKVA